MEGKELLSGWYIEQTKKFNYIINPNEYYLTKFIHWTYIENIFKIPAVNSFNINHNEPPYLDNACIIILRDGIVSEQSVSIYRAEGRMRPTEKYLLKVRDIGEFIVRRNDNGDYFFENESGIKPSVIKDDVYVLLYIGDV
jgi:hypothetical protein